MTTTEQINLFDLDTVSGPPGELVVKRVNHETARVPCEQWHYLGGMPSTATDIYGIWESGTFKGVIVFGGAVAQKAHWMFGLDPTEIRELLRIAMRGHDAPITQALSLAIKDLRQTRANLKLLLSYADTGAGHAGYVYQAASWVYLGKNPTKPYYRINGELFHERSAGARFGSHAHGFLRANVDPDFELIPQGDKHKYAFGLTRQVKRQLAAMAQPYPKG